MFTGLITDVGRIMEVSRPTTGTSDLRFRVGTKYKMQDVAMGASIACNGCCLTVTEKGPDWFAVEVSAETLSKTTLGAWTIGSAVNLERSLKAGDDMGGHIVSGHVDGIAQVITTENQGGSKRFTIRPPASLLRFVAPKGSVALDGVSLTVNEVGAKTFGVNIIAHTQVHTNFGALKPGDSLNMEIDVLARYVARLLEGGPAAQTHG